MLKNWHSKILKIKPIKKYRKRILTKKEDDENEAIDESSFITPNL